MPKRTHRGLHSTAARQPPELYVRQAFRIYRECGIFAYGCARCKCDDCAHDYLVAYSCKASGTRPSCNTRCMAEDAVHLFPPPPTFAPMGTTAPARQPQPNSTSAQSPSSTASAPASTNMCVWPGWRRRALEGLQALKERHSDIDPQC